MQISVEGGVSDLARDMIAIPVPLRRKMVTTLRANAERGNQIASRFAKESAGAHGKHYPRAFSAQALTPLIWEYGPDASKPQGGMSFENGSRNQPPHNDLAKSQDIIGPAFHDDVDKILDGLFW